VADDYVNFENALKELKLTAEQLKRLVSEGEIRAIRGDNNSMKFRREEIERLKQDTGKTIQYTEESSDTLTDDLLFDEASDLEVDEEGMQTAQISSDDTFVGDDVGMTTAPIKGGKAAPPKGPVKPVTKGGKGGGKTPPPPPRPAKTQAAPIAAARPPSSGGQSRAAATQSVRRTTGRSTRMRQTSALEAATGVSTWVVAILILGFIVAAYGLLVWWDIANDRVSSPVQPLADWAFDTFAK